MRIARILLALALGITGLHAQPAPEGDWLGTLRIQSASLRIVFHVSRTDGGWKVTMDSPDQGANGLPVDNVVVDGRSVLFGSSMVRGTYKGTIQAGDSVIDGTWSQSGMSFPLTLARTTGPVTIKRPQEPKPPFPYATEEVTFRNERAGIDLAGTLSIPPGAGPFPAVLLVSGSGPQDRDETIFNHRPFRVIADHLARAGIAVLRYDDRGVARSTGSFRDATTVDFSDDAEAGIAFLKRRPEVDGKHIGIIGHSEGALVAPMVAVRNKDVAFVVLLAGPSVTGAQIIIAQDSLISAADGAPSEAIGRGLETNRRIFALITEASDTTGLRARIVQVLRDAAAQNPDTTLPPAQVEAQVQRTAAQLISPWMRFFLAYDPYPTLTRLKCPALALFGEKDLQVPPAINIPRMKEAFRRAGNTRAIVKELPDLNHLFQHAASGSPGEYAGIEETFAPSALDEITSWILAVSKEN